MHALRWYLQSGRTFNHLSLSFLISTIDRGTSSNDIFRRMPSRCSSLVCYRTILKSAAAPLHSHLPRLPGPGSSSCKPSHRPRTAPHAHHRTPTGSSRHSAASSHRDSPSTPRPRTPSAPCSKHPWPRYPDDCSARLAQGYAGLLGSGTRRRRGISGRPTTGPSSAATSCP